MRSQISGIPIRQRQREITQFRYASCDHSKNAVFGPPFLTPNPTIKLKRALPAIGLVLLSAAPGVAGPLEDAADANARNREITQVAERG